MKTEYYVDGKRVDFTEYRKVITSGVRYTISYYSGYERKVLCVTTKP